MKTNLSDLIAALPQEENGPDLLDSAEAQERLQEIFADLAYKPIPVHSLHRMWTMGELSTQIALAYTSLWIRGLFADAKTKERQSIETNLRVALKMIHRLGYLRGAAIKLGQAFGSLPELLPSQVVSTMDKLHAQAPPMHFSLVREVFRSEFGKDPSDLFASFDKEAFAAASIGQVHRATLKSGEEVAVKIQYPGIGRAMHADLRNLTALIFPTRLSKRAASIKGSVEAMRDMLEQEMDYVQEARNMREVYAFFTPADGIVVPRVFGEYSTSRVLTSEFISGPNLTQFLAANPSQEQRDEFGRKISLAWYRMYYAHTSYSDPHSGNYVFMSDGRLGLLDFGCVQRFTPEDLHICDIGDKFIDGQMNFEEMMLRSGHSQADVANEDYKAPCRRHCAWLTAPVSHDGPFDFGNPEFFNQGIDSIKEMVEKVYPSAPMYLYFFRSLFGLRVLSYQLKCRFDIGAIRRQERKPWMA
jgi:predicted unusual protein kinase regulating ubiquinone biosynthesis (AarF/ABC1/UbiB family)